MSVATYKPNSTDCGATTGSTAGRTASDPPGSLAVFDSPADITGTDLTNISTDDDNYHQALGMGAVFGQRPYFKVTQAEGIISKLKITVKGYGAGGIMQNGWYLFVYDDAGGHWDAYIGSTTSASKATLTYEITANIANFISATGMVYIEVNGLNPAMSPSTSRLFYAELEVTYTEAPTSTIKSVLGVPVADIKSIAGVPIASVKSVLGVPNS